MRVFTVSLKTSPGFVEKFKAVVLDMPAYEFPLVSSKAVASIRI